MQVEFDKKYPALQSQTDPFQELFSAQFFIQVEFDKKKPELHVHSFFPES